MPRNYTTNAFHEVRKIGIFNGNCLPVVMGHASLVLMLVWTGRIVVVVKYTLNMEINQWWWWWWWWWWW